MRAAERNYNNKTTSGASLFNRPGASVFKRRSHVIKEKLLESEVLVKQATSNTKEQFAGSPDLGFEVEGAIIDALDAHTTMSTQALESKQVQREIIKILLNHSSLYEDLRERASAV